MRHWRVAREALALEKAACGLRLGSRGLDFLQAVRAVTEGPVSPTARVTAWVAVCKAGFHRRLDVLGKVDVVASAEGRILPFQNVKLAQAARDGRVRCIYMHDGDAMRQRQPLSTWTP